MRFLFIAVMLLATSLKAELAYPNYSQLNSSVGVLVVRQLTDGSQQLFVAGQPVGGLKATKVYLHGVYNHKTDRSQTVLLSLRHGPGQCRDIWAMVRITGNQVLPTAPFGGCAELPEWFGVVNTGLELAFDHPDPLVVSTSFQFDAQGLMRKDTLLADINNDVNSGDAPLPELDWAKWKGRASAEFLQDPLERFRFQYIGFDLPTLLNQMQTSGAIFSDGAFLYGYGCIKSQCDRTHAAFSVPLFGGYPNYVYYDENSQRKSGGTTPSGLPERLKQFYYTGAFAH